MFGFIVSYGIELELVNILGSTDKMDLIYESTGPEVIPEATSL
jgi:hypothetical protein